MRRLPFLLMALLWAFPALALPVLHYEAGPGLFAPLGGWSKVLGAGPIFSVGVAHPWKTKILFGAGLGFLQLRGKEDRDLKYEGIPFVVRGDYRLLRLHSDQEVWAWAGGGVLRSRVAFSGGQETSTDPLLSLGLSGSIPLTERLRLAMEARYDEVFAIKQHARGMSLGLGLRLGR